MTDNSVLMMEYVFDRMNDHNPLLLHQWIQDFYGMLRGEEE